MKKSGNESFPSRLSPLQLESRAKKGECGTGFQEPGEAVSKVFPPIFFLPPLCHTTVSFSRLLK